MSISLAASAAACAGSTTGTAWNGHGAPAAGAAGTVPAVDGDSGLTGHAGADGARVGRPPDSCVGCAPAPLCGTACTDSCGCCPCVTDEMLPDGTKQTCNVDCYVIEPESPATGPRCLYQGLSYYPNSVFYAPDDCNVCTCEASGEISCTTKTCAACDPSTSDHRREYLTHAVDGGTRLATSTECATLVIDCGGVASMFRNACGCGCEQPASCPEVFNCRGAKPGGPSCDVMKMTEACPFSEILF